MDPDQLLSTGYHYLPDVLVQDEYLLLHFLPSTGNQNGDVDIIMWGQDRDHIPSGAHLRLPH